MKSVFIYLLLFTLIVPVSATQIDSLQQLSIDSLMIWLDDKAESNNEIFPEVAYHVLSRVLEKKDFTAVATVHDRISFWNYINYEVNGIDTTMYHRVKQIEYDAKAGNIALVGKGYIDLAIDLMNDHQYNRGERMVSAVN